MTQELYERYAPIVAKNGLALRNVPYVKYSYEYSHEYKELCWAAVQNTPLALRCVPDTLKTYELCKFAVRDTDMAWPYVPTKHQYFLIQEFEERARGRLLLMLIVFISSVAGFFVLAFILGKVWVVVLPIIYALFCWLLYNREHKALVRRLVIQIDVMSRSRELMKIQEEGNYSSRFVEVGGLCWYNKLLTGGSGAAASTTPSCHFYTVAAMNDGFLEKMGLRAVTEAEWREFEKKTYRVVCESGGTEGVFFIDKTDGKNVWFPFVGYWNKECPGELDHTYRGEYRLDAGMAVRIERSGHCIITPQDSEAGLPVICVAL